MELITLAKNPVPSGPVVGAFNGYDGNPLRYALWHATRGPRRGTICLFHGRAEFIEKYFETIADLRGRGFAVATFDWRGQGASYRTLPNRMKGHIRDFAEYEKDIFRFMKDIVLPDCPPPFFALAHSMGGNILLRHAIKQGSWFDRIILTAPMLAFADERIGMPQNLARLYALTGTYAGMATSFVYGGNELPEGGEKFETNTLTSDRERWSRNRAVLEVAPELGVGSPTVGWLRAAYRSNAMIAHPEFAADVKVPVMLFAAGKDEIVSTRAIEEFGVRLKVGNVVLIPGCKHEILQERDVFRQRFWAAFDAYLGVKKLAA
ncbi:MAG: alpha/beta hydrolase [Alphaproteobacteria bacterium]|nr:alpha/beta hydrolase [Alphaproteobacteria bacterium]